MPSWNELADRSRTEQQASEASQDFDRLCARALATADGAELLRAMRERYLEASENPAAAEPYLRVRAAQQQMVRDLEKARDRGLAAIAAAKKSG